MAIDSDSKPMRSESDAYLPPELERLIFIYAFRDRTQAPTNLFLVAKRIKEWLLPIAFEVVLIHTHRYFPIKFTTIPKFKQYGHHIRHLLITAPLSDYPTPELTNVLDECLSLCPNIINLALWCRRPSIRLESLFNLSQLTCLSMDIEHLIKIITDQATQSQTSGPSLPPGLFPKITHLDAIGMYFQAHTAETQTTTLAHHFPSLTHIAVLNWTVNQPGIVRMILHKSSNLKALVWWNPITAQGDLGLRLDAEETLPVDDERIVAVVSSRVMDWENAARGIGMGMWDFADMVLEKRRVERTRRVVDDETRST
ncbi:hypothetical protein BDN72DRAFT_880786 [Pluteus cervinus]|uniref:Uncharacterized protein n=1 Tax=Pluteus cervinus TaxID=181527 RepID=A0ACD3AJD9_9AGAR|nr:hypothetical protein BDN72DRAFT_880786 [Pluteus cervinus]